MVWSPPGSRYTIWAAASKAIRQPSREDSDVRIGSGDHPAQRQFRGVGEVGGQPANYKPEELRDYELGYRSELTKTLSLDVATFLSFYHHLETIEPQAPIIIPGSPRYSKFRSCTRMRLMP